MKTVILLENILDPSTCSVHQVESVCFFLKGHFGQHFPETGRIYHEEVVKGNDVTPRTDADIEHLESLDGTFYVVIYPAAPDVVVSGSLLVAVLTISWAVDQLFGKDRERPAQLRELTGSPNNVLSDRQNKARIRERIPDIYGMVRSTPDLIMLPYTVYVDNRETEISYMCIGRGIITATDIREEDTLCSQIPGVSVAVYEPGNIPTGVEGTSIRQTQIGDFIADPVYNVKQLRAVNGQICHPDNHFTVLGDRASAQPDRNGGGLWFKAHFRNNGSGEGQIEIGTGTSEVLEKLDVGDIIHLNAPTETVNTPTGTQFIDPNRKVNLLNVTKFWCAYQNGTGAIPDLTGDYEIIDIIPPSGAPSFDPLMIVLDVSGNQTEWDRIDTYVAGIDASSAGGTNGVIANGRASIEVPNKEWVGPFFFDDEVFAPNTREIVCNFVAQSGLYADDGKTLKGFDVTMEIEVTPADDDGLPLGIPIGSDPLPTDQSEIILPSAPEDRTIFGAIANRNTRAKTVRFTPTTTGKFLIRARRDTRTPWKEDAPHQFGGIATTATGQGPAFDLGLVNTGASTIHAASTYWNGGVAHLNNQGAVGGNSTYLVFKGNSQDEIQWTHCFSLKTVEKGNFGDVTTVHARTVASEATKQAPARRLNLLAQRQVQTWNGSTFGGSAVIDRKAENALFTILKDPEIGNLSDSQIDFTGIAAAFAEVRAYFGGADADEIGGDVAGEFNYTFDDQEMSLEEMIGIVCNTCFCVPYREGDIVKVKTDLASAPSTILVNHRNRIPGSEQRTIRFGTEADYDGILLDYTDIDILRPNDDAVRTYSVPPLESALNPLVLSIPGIRTKRHAAWHAWRAYNKLLFQKETITFQVTEEAALLTLNDRIRIADGTRAETQDGEVLEVNSLTLRLSQPVDISSGDHTIFLQHTDGTVESIPIASSPSAREVVLANAPSLSLVTSVDSAVRTAYQIVPNASTRTGTYLLADKRRTDRGIYDMTANNYSNAFFWNDGLYLWIPIITQLGLTDIRDWGPYELTLAANGSATTVTDATRGRVYQGTTASDHVSITTVNIFAAESYTKSCWVFINTNDPGGILCSVETNTEFFLLSSGPNPELRSGHSSIVYVQSANFPTGGWHHAAVSYDAASQIMNLYVDGELVDTASSVPGRSLTNLRAFGQFAGTNGLIGLADDLRYWMRVLSDEEIRELYQKTRIQ